MTKKSSIPVEPAKQAKLSKTITKDKSTKDSPKVETDLKLIHRKIMEQNGCDIASYITIRKDFHKHAEIAFKEFRTQQKIIDILKTFGLKDKEIRKCAGTGLVVDITGTGPADKSPGC